MKKFNGLLFVASLFLLIGCVIKFADLLIEIPKAVEICGLVSMCISFVLHIIVLARMKKQNKHRKKRRR